MTLTKIACRQKLRLIHRKLHNEASISNKSLKEVLDFTCSRFSFLKGPEAYLKSRRLLVDRQNTEWGMGTKQFERMFPNLSSERIQTLKKQSATRAETEEVLGQESFERLQLENGQLFRTWGQLKNFKNELPSLKTAEKHRLIHYLQQLIS